MVRKVLTYPSEYMHSEISIEDAKEWLLAIHDAIDIAEQGHRADMLELRSSKVVAIKASKQFENDQVYITVVPDAEILDLRIV